MPIELVTTLSLTHTLTGLRCFPAHHEKRLTYEERTDEATLPRHEYGPSALPEDTSRT